MWFLKTLSPPCVSSQTSASLRCQRLSSPCTFVPVSRTEHPRAPHGIMPVSSFVCSEFNPMYCRRSALLFICIWLRLYARYCCAEYHGPSPPICRGVLSSSLVVVPREVESGSRSYRPFRQLALVHILVSITHFFNSHVIETANCSIALKFRN